MVLFYSRSGTSYLVSCFKLVSRSLKVSHSKNGNCNGYHQVKVGELDPPETFFGLILDTRSEQLPIFDANNGFALEAAGGFGNAFGLQEGDIWQSWVLPNVKDWNLA